MKCRHQLSCIILIVIGISATANAAGDEVQTPAPNKPPEKLAEIDNYISRSHKAIDEEYTNRIKKCRERTQKEITDFEATQRDQLAQSAVNRSWFMQNMGYVPTQGYTQVETDKWLPTERIDATEKRIAQKKAQMQSDMERTVANLEKEKQYYLDTSSVRLEKRLKDNVLHPKPDRPDGMVVGILYSDNKQLALIDQRLFRPGDMIRDVKVVTIDKDEVEFEKNGHQWRQRVGNQPNTFWNETN